MHGNNLSVQVCWVVVLCLCFSGNVFSQLPCTSLQVLQPEQTKSKFQELTAHFEQALSGISYYQLNIPNEIKEQVIFLYRSGAKWYVNLFVKWIWDDHIFWYLSLEERVIALIYPEFWVYFIHLTFLCWWMPLVFSKV